MSIAPLERSPTQSVAPRDGASPARRSAAPQSKFETYPWLKPLVSGWLLFHVIGVALYPAAILVPARGLLSVLSDTFYARYMEGLYMVQGHRFFAPEPGAGTLIEYRVERADGSVEQNTFPRREITPRLLYHRHFMLSERVQDVGEEPEWYRMYARHLAHEFGGVRVQLWRVVHRLATPDDILAGKQLDDEEFYERNELGDWTREQLNAPWNPLPEESADTADDVPADNADPKSEAAETEEIQP